MKNRITFWPGCICVICLVILVLDAETAINGAKDGVLLCINVILPSLFPFFILTAILNSILAGTQWNILRPLGKLCGIPAGGESMLLLGLLGGYPVGAQCINQAYRNKIIDRSTAQRMLGFCNNAGPAFIFGMLGSLFSSKAAPWCLWCTQIMSAIFVGIILPGKTRSVCLISEKNKVNLTTAIDISIKNLAKICAWVVLFRVLLVFLQRWFMWMLPSAWQTVITGILELSNGCISVKDLQPQGLQYILATGMISFGGLCVGMQTQSVTQDIGLGLYFPGKLLQAYISIIFSWITQYLIFAPQDRISLPWWVGICLIVPYFYLYLRKSKKVVAISGLPMYNK